MEDKRKVLIVEDEDNMRSLIKYNLDREDYDVSTARNGQEGLVLVKEKRPDLIISDVMMPKMNGIEFCRILREDPNTKGIPFIFLSAKGQLPDKVEGLDTGADDYMTKPFIPKELLEMVKTRIRRVDVYKHIADTDELTSLYNRRALMEKLRESLAEAVKSSSELFIGFLDVDLFRKINERYGHPLADEALKALARAIKDSVGGKDIAGRYGGEEFLIVITGNTGEGAAAMLEQVRSAVEKLSFSPTSMKITVSIGASCFPGDSRTAEELIEEADKALFRAKQTGRNRVVVFSKMKGK